MSEAADVAYIKQVEEKYYGVEKKLAVLNIFRWIFRIAILSMIVLFLLGTFKVFKKAVDPKAVAPHFEDEMTLIAPMVIDASKEVAEDILPVYQATAEERLKDLRPMLEQKVHDETERYEHEFKKHTTQSLRDTINRVSNKQILALGDKIPELKTPEGRGYIREKIRHLLLLESQEIMPMIFDRFHADLEDIKGSLLNFKDNKYTNYDKDELQRYFAHLWLMLLDQYIMDPESIDKGWK